MIFSKTLIAGIVASLMCSASVSAIDSYACAADNMNRKIVGTPVGTPVGTLADCGTCEDGWVETPEDTVTANGIKKNKCSTSMVDHCHNKYATYDPSSKTCKTQCNAYQEVDPTDLNAETCKVRFPKDPKRLRTGHCEAGYVLRDVTQGSTTIKKCVEEMTQEKCTDKGGLLVSTSDNKCVACAGDDKGKKAFTDGTCYPVKQFEVLMECRKDHREVELNTKSEPSKCKACLDGYVDYDKKCLLVVAADECSVDDHREYKKDKSVCLCKSGFKPVAGAEESDSAACEASSASTLVISTAAVIASIGSLLFLL